MAIALCTLRILSDIEDNDMKTVRFCVHYMCILIATVMLLHFTIVTYKMRPIEANMTLLYSSLSTDRDNAQTRSILHRSKHISLHTSKCPE